jgi:hypothetical protein
VVAAQEAAQATGYQMESAPVVKDNRRTMSAERDPVARLAEYWFRAKMMHDFLHSLMDEYDRDIDEIYEEHRWEFEMFMSHWLSGLFVVVEGFNKLKLRDTRVKSLFKGHLRYLKAMRHETYHFVVKKGGGDVDRIFRELNLAEELHEAIGTFIREYVATKAEESGGKNARKKRKKKSS